MKKVRLVRQTEQDTCGAACLAMLAGSTEQKMLEFLTESGHFDNGTTKTDIRWALINWEFSQVDGGPRTVFGEQKRKH